MMGLGSKSRVQVGFRYHFPGLGWVRVSKSLVQVGFEYYFSGSGQVRVPKKLGFSPGFRVFGYLNPSLEEIQIYKLFVFSSSCERTKVLM